MLIPAIMYKDEIERRSKSLCYSDEAFYYGDGLGQNYIQVQMDDDYGELFQYAIIDESNDLIGYFRYRIHWYNSCAHCFGLVNLSGKPNAIIGLDINKELEKIIHEYKVHRVEFRMISGNPVEKHYRRFVNKYHGRVVILKDALKDRYGKYHDDLTFEIIFNEGDKR